MSIILAIETSQRTGSVAMRDRAGTVHVEPLALATRHDDDLLPAIDRLLKREGLSPHDLDENAAVAVSIGPGAFTGLRIAVSTAKMIAEARRVKLVAVPSALVVAESLSETIRPGPVLIALASKNDTFWATRLECASDGWRVVGTPGLVDAASLDLSSLRTVVCDQHLPTAARLRCEEAGVLTIEPRFEAAACLAVAARMLKQGEITDALSLAPLYPREPEAVSIWERHRAGASDAKSAR
ncbi:MAG TPA: tRNA (adenosine(37)-N6)-threonylcarbamoyltransferase complex dimerization subunit type 1 TsaB [Phycisphaerales bacterium]|nr:tRNA (adenosine(37)-N6)-threonylcarbamoyltransferase complex dimerization subunit type 1 TsaB [Phycisphaerales bacterium]